MITGRQIRAARSLLEWKAEDLAKAAGLTRVTVSNLEAEAVQPQERTMASITAAFDRHGIEFLDGEGVRLRQHEVRVFTGKAGHKQYLEHVYGVLKSNGGRIRQFNLSDEERFPYAGDAFDEHLRKMEAIHNIDARALIRQGDGNFPAKYCVYRWLDRMGQKLIPFYVYNDYVSLPIIKSDHNIETLSIHSKLLAVKYSQQFDLFWSTSLDPIMKGGD
ncbi:MAG: helix-turn-helix transcriptional regulator [Alphaproteobacteria bacterium]|nr:helix-turn-helix transcriptional regulator [Alphaproteobacteria bacterium]